MNREFDFTLTGVTDLLMSADDIALSDKLSEWRKDPKNKKVSVAGDDRSPAWSWLTRTYFDDKGVVTIPQECVMASLRGGAAQVVMKGQTTFKRVSQSGILIMSEYCRFTFKNGKQFKLSDFEKIEGEPFTEHLKLAEKLGFRLFAKRAKVGEAKHVRVRPRFSEWEVSGVLTVTEEVITEGVLSQMFEIAGRQVGLCDWRPGSPKSPGPFGIYKAVVKKRK